MSTLVVTGWGAVSSAGVGTGPLAAALRRGSPGPTTGLSQLYDEPMPVPAAHACTDLDAPALLGRKGTSFLDRATTLALVACGQAIEDSAIARDPEPQNRIGVALGTTVGSFRSSSDYSRETLAQDRPYLVNPVLFPNTVMNCAAGQTAIRYGLGGVNSTVAAGDLGFLAALRYGATMLRRGYADAMLAGAVEELTPHAVWAHHVRRRAGLPGEAAVAFMVEPAAAAAYAGRRPLIQVAPVVTGYCPGGDPERVGEALAGCVGRALHLAEVGRERIRWVAGTAGPTDSAGGPEPERVEAAAVTAVLGDRPVERVVVGPVVGDCGAATGALCLAALLVRATAPDIPEEAAGLLVGCSSEGAVGAAVVKVASGVRAGS
jgi:3-oxoacyl-[acyl-carrier-protein] synthase II